MITEQEVAYYKKPAPELKKVAVMALNSLFPKAIAADLADSAKSAGFEVDYNTIYSPDTTDFYNAFRQIKSLNPDWIYASGYTQDLVTIRRQMNEVGVSAKVISMTAGPAYPDFGEKVKDLDENVSTSSWWHGNANY